MKKVIMLFAMLVMGIGYAIAQNQADIKFDKTEHDFGAFSQDKGTVTTEFTFTNVGNAPLVIHEVEVSCSCTVSDFTKEAVLPGRKGIVKVTFNARGTYPGTKFTRSVTVYSNAITRTVRLFIKGEVLADVK